ncbi:MAG: cyclic pyranopterin phosphate synthase [Chlamydiales bacterium]|jgi:cyclic pyranopterin phosphate synthase
MPEAEYVWLPKEKLLTFEETGQLVDAFIELGVNRVRLTGGEPLLRRGLAGMVGQLRQRKALRDIALTTNGLQLAEHALDLRRAGLDRVTISLDTLQPERYRALTRRDGLENALAGIRAACDVGFASVKLNTVVLRGTNDDELTDLLEFARAHGIEARFIEYMDVGGATHWSAEDVVSRTEILERLEAHYGSIEREQPLPGAGSAPARRYRLPDGTLFGVIASTTQPFCGSCDRSRLTADGNWYTCLYSRRGDDLRALLRAGHSHGELVEHLRARWSGRDDRGAEERLGMAQRIPLAGAEELQQDPHLEMHTRGG